MAKTGGQDVEFVTLGMFIIDDIYPPEQSDQKPQLNVIGGAGTYSAVGARLLSPQAKSKAVGWIVDAGNDFPAELHATIDSWNTNVLIRDRPAPTTRGWNGYSGNQHRAFKYLTEKKRLTADDLTPELTKAESFHLICSPLRCIDQVKDILKWREVAPGSVRLPRPLIIWEPVPDLATAEELENTIAALKYVDVVSPNHEELAALFGVSSENGVSKTMVEDLAGRFLASGIGEKGEGAVVVRAGAVGCFIGHGTHGRWLPAFHQDPTKVVDPTGGGNGFLGGFAVGLVRTKDYVEAARWGSVAASFCIEQTGVPKLDAPTLFGQQHEKWNGVNVLERLSDFTRRTPP
ncbi:hypothetical protein M409DRAFT_21751 [Zasmidium cellare ATCC 36951]|uniref:Carbohydrate kinase PfkB domain-containing protein n=1 Tax=Zasmidium cellare ATCC 36951 TaxID=1080233 RepID=A0A6A6CMB7_ZASCE|nr:uncharacterized protein M409DRAFT_21751 [Zasmidium cellare ATCC 36951]KAF2168314.1 hypothetical protein M409DRAFT_21751 [Zasmidium cellare ATCC 36951]